MPQSSFRLPQPAGGLDRRLAYTDQQPATTPLAKNFLPDDTSLDRRRVGTRPGMEKALTTDTGSALIDCIADVSYNNSGNHASKIVVVANGVLYYNAPGGTTLTAVGTPGAVLATGYQLGFAELYQKLYFVGDNAGDKALCVYNPADNTLDQVTISAGTFPPDCTLMANFNNRIVVAGNPASPQSWYFSRQGDATDWDFGVEGDVQAAASAVNNDQGRLGEKIEALIPHSSDCMFFGCTSSFWAMQGDIQAGGRLTKIAENIGVWGPRAWCYDTNGYLYFLAPQGLYGMPPGCGSVPREISRAKLPQELIGIDKTAYRVSMGYDIVNRGVLICVTSISGTTSTMFFLKTEGNESSFWEVVFANTDHQIVELFSLRERAVTTVGPSTMLMGCRDGYIRRFNRTVTNDDGTNIAAQLAIGPFPLGQENRDGILRQVQVTLGAGSGTVQCTARAANSAQEAYGATPFFTASLTQTGLNRSFYPCVRGSHGVLEFSNVASSVISFEEMTAKTLTFGERRA